MREHILSEIRRLAKETGTVPGYRTFERETGIARHEWMGKYWARWGDALSEAGYSSNEFGRKLDTASILTAIIAACRHYNKIPTQAELKIYRRTEPAIPSSRAISNHFQSRAGLLAALAKRVSEDESYSDIAVMLPSDVQETPKKLPSSAKNPDGFVYLIKSGDFYKIGRSDDLERRVKEIRTALPDKASLAHTIRTDDPPGIESYWHRRFEEKRANGEWFKLSPHDVAAFKKRKYQ